MIDTRDSKPQLLKIQFMSENLILQVRILYYKYDLYTTSENNILQLTSKNHILQVRIWLSYISPARLVGRIIGTDVK